MALLSQRVANIQRSRLDGPSSDHVEIALEHLATCDGFIGAAVVDSLTGLWLATKSVDGFDIEHAATLHADVVAEGGMVENIAASSEHVEFMHRAHDGAEVFVYLVLDRGQADLKAASHALHEVGSSLSL